ncbi:MAG TPA: hypothetical protein VNG95_02745 [Gemmatimonadales bacterium]|nr:hypothetical protein [Gemmatimonadales bacterium]
MSPDVRWTANAIVGLIVGAAIAGAAFAAGVFSDAGALKDMNGARVVAEASADSLVQYLRRGRCYAGPIRHDSLEALRLEAHLR